MTRIGFQPLRRRRAIDLVESHFGPNMTPMVDVVMVILVFFMVSAAFLGPEWLLPSLVPQMTSPAVGVGKPSEQPKTDDPLSMPAVRYTIELKRQPDGSVTANGAGVSDGTIEAVVAALKSQIEPGAEGMIEVLIKPGQGVAWGPVVRVTETCQKFGIKRVGPMVR